MKAEILCVGTELLLGEVVNTNAAFLSSKLASLGIFVYYHTVCGDNPQRLSECLELSLRRSDIIIMTGGLGPTYDDMTKETVAKTLSLPLVIHKPSLDKITDFFKKSDRIMTENNKKQAFIPKDAIVFSNNYGTAPALAIEKENKIIIMLPGPPREMKPIFNENIQPYLKKFSTGTLFSSNIHFFGIGESSVENLLHDMMEKHTNPTIAPYAQDGEVRVRITAYADDLEKAKQMTIPVISKIKELFPEYIYGVDIPNLEYALVKLLKEKNLKVAFAESCTGGLVSKRITDISGSSEVFEYGLCVYANEAKKNLLKVSQQTLDKYGAVSEQTAKEMAEGMLKLSNSDIAVSVTGIAGPLGGSEEKPVGLVYIGCACKNGEYFGKKLLLGRGNADNRDFIRMLSSSHALKTALESALCFHK